MIVNSLSEILSDNIHVIIIGSGPAGISTALKLEKNKIKSLILEAGGIQQSADSHEYLKGEFQGDEYPRLSSLRMRQFGGTSALWGGSCNPFREEDLYEWPIKLKDLNEYSLEAKQILNLKKNFYDEKFSENLKIYSVLWSNVKFGKKYFEHIKKSKFINLSLNTVFFNFNGKGKKIDNITCFKSGKFLNLKANYYVLSCGGIENSRLMLWAKEKNKTLFSHKLPIGKYYMNHPYYLIGEGLIFYKKYNEYFFNNNIMNKPLTSCEQRIHFSADNNFIIKNKILNSGIYLYFNVFWKYNSLFKQLRCVAPKYFKEVYDKIKAKEAYQIKIYTLQEQKPLEENFINLSNKLDPLNIPLAKIYWKRSFSEIKSAKTIAEELGGVFIDNEIGRIALYNYLYSKTDAYNVITGNHQLGGTRMGHSPNDSVVDKNLKVHDVENLFINGSSVFRTGGHNHPTYTIVKLALRLGDHLKNLKNIQN